MGSMHLGLEGLDRRRGVRSRRSTASGPWGGAALIVTGGSAVSRVGAGGRNYSFVNEDADAVKLAAVATAVHDAGGRVLLQLFHAGRYAYEASFGLTPVAPSAVYSALQPLRAARAVRRGGARDDRGLRRGAARARELGFDGVEIMGSEGYLVDQFLAPATNLRDDEWGGDSERRMRFALEVAAAVRAAAGPGQAVVFRMSGASFVEGGGTQADVLDLARALASDGAVDAINVGMGWHEARVPTVQALVPHGAWRPWARAVKEAVGRARHRFQSDQHGGARRGRACGRGRATSCRWRGRFWRTRRSSRRRGLRPRAGGERLHRLQPGMHRPLDLRSSACRASSIRAPATSSSCRRTVGAGGPGALAPDRGRRRWARRHGGGARPRRRRPSGLAVRGL